MSNKTHERIKALIPYFVSFTVNVLYGFFISLMSILEIFLMEDSSILRRYTGFQVIVHIFTAFWVMLLINFIMAFVFRKHEAIHKETYWITNFTLAMLPYTLPIVLSIM